MVSKKNHKVPKTGPVWRMSAEEATLASKPRYNGFACGSGAHGDCKYNRTRVNRAWQKEIRIEGTSRRGPFDFRSPPSKICIMYSMAIAIAS